MPGVFKILLIALFVHNAASVASQGKFKAGIGYNLISNNGNIEGLDSYLAPSFHFSYTFLNYQKLSLAMENATSIRIRESTNSYEVGITSSVPLMLQYDFSKWVAYFGAGPAYLVQKAKVNQYNHSIEGSYLNITCGSGFKLKPFFMDILYPEISLRLSYYRNFHNAQNDAGLITCIVFLSCK